jgi:hypothetical protein
MDKKFVINLLDAPSGNPDGKYAYAVVAVDKDDTEDTTTEIWLADGEDQLCELVKAEYTKDAVSEEMADKMFDDEWGFSILTKCLGEVYRQVSEVRKAKTYGEVITENAGMIRIVDFLVDERVLDENLEPLRTIGEINEILSYSFGDDACTPSMEEFMESVNRVRNAIWLGGE